MSAIDDTRGELTISQGSSLTRSNAQASSPESLPRQIGTYKILGLLGAGGMGVVYLAEQKQPQRRVALKVMQPGTASHETLHRFEVEAQALGRLQHDGIARIYDAGAA